MVKKKCQTRSKWVIFSFETLWPVCADSLKDFTSPSWRQLREFLRHAEMGNWCRWSGWATWALARKAKLRSIAFRTHWLNISDGLLVNHELHIGNLKETTACKLHCNFDKCINLLTVTTSYEYDADYALTPANLKWHQWSAPGFFGLWTMAGCSILRSFLAAVHLTRLQPPGHGISISYITFNVFQHHMVCLNISMLVLMWEPPFPRLTVDRSRGRRGWQDVSQYLKMQATESIFLSRSISQDMFEWQKKGFQWFPVPFVAFFHCWPCRWFEKQFLNVSHSRLWRNPGAKNHEFLDQIIRSESFSTIQISEFVVNGLLGLLGQTFL